MEAFFLKALPILLGSLQSGIALLFAGAVKLYLDYRKTKQDLRIAFNKIRELEKRDTGKSAIVESSENRCTACGK